MVKKKKKLQPEWNNREPKYQLDKDKQQYILHAWAWWEGNGHGDKVTYSHSYCNTAAGWEKAQKKAREYADKGYTVSITKAGVN